MTVPRNSTVLRAAIVVDPAEPTQRVNSAVSIRKAAQRRLEGLLRKAARADEGGKMKDLFWSPLRQGVLVGGSLLGHQYDQSLIEPILFSKQSEFRTSIGSSLSLDRACVELGVADLFLKDGDESMSIDGVKTLLDVEFQKPARGSLLFFDSS
ncbi:hypothetical protein Tco_1043516 [Tanacetum coccineum]|uniref:Uncharacterized protein n=1 Tax=Tanacetum coccineum TaxID=301880 RepID=A0ABQ5GMB1_9ASTR